MRTEQYIMKSSNIGRLNEALTVMRHFVDLSLKLLPFLDEINKKEQPSVLEIEDKKKILSVYREYQFDEKTSRHLIDSNVLILIKKPTIN